MARTPYHTISTRSTPANQPAKSGTVTTVRNSEGGQSFGVSEWTRLQRFLILGSTGGTFYASEQKFTQENAAIVTQCLDTDPTRTIDLIVEISEAGRNPKQQPLIFAYAMACGYPDAAIRKYALDRLRRVCRTGTHLFLFASYIEQFRGWGRSLRKAVGDWYLIPATRVAEDDDEMIDAEDPMAGHVKWLTYQLAKYRQREGWSHRDLLRLSKPPYWSGEASIKENFRGSLLEGALGWAVGKTEGKNVDSFLQAVDEAQTADVRRLIDLIDMFRLPWEVVPSEKLAEPRVWKALLPYMGMGALVRNLGRLTANGTLKPLDASVDTIVHRLGMEEVIRRSRLHPISVLVAAAAYNAGRGVKGSLKWDPIQDISVALDKTFKLAFGNIVPAEKRTLVAVDVSASMGWGNIAGTFITPRVGAAAMALVTLASEPKTHLTAFSHEMVPVNGITKASTLTQVLSTFDRIPMGGTDCSLPMLYAMEKGLQVDTFVVYTDSETGGYGRAHPFQALEKYRQASGINAKLIVVGMVSNGFSIAAPGDPGMLDVVGFDTNAPGLMADFSAGRL